MPSRRHLLALVPAVALAVSACSTGPTGSAGGSAAAEAATADATTHPVTIEHALGSTTITSVPQRVATVGWSDADAVLALGVVPVGAPKITWGGNAADSTDWFDARADELGVADGDIARYDDTAGIPYEAIAAAAPDLILGVNSGIDAQEYDKLTKIAPTVAYPGPAWGTSWEDSLEIIGTALGRTDEADTLRATTDAAIDDALAEHPEIAGRSAAWGWFTPTDLSTIGLYTSSDLRPQMLRRFGLVDSPTVAELSEGTGQFSVNLSAEKASSLSADLLVFYAEGAEGVTNDPLLSRIPAIASGQYVASADNTIALAMSSPSPLSIPVAVEEFLPKIAQALSGRPAS